MDPANEGFLLRCESNPALYMRCSMLWMGSWEVPSMERLPLQVFAGVPEEHLAAAERPALVKQMVKLHESHVPHGATPRMYVSFLGIWRKLFEQQRAKVALTLTLTLTPSLTLTLTPTPTLSLTPNPNPNPNQGGRARRAYP